MGASTKLILFQILQTFDCHSREACPRPDWGAGIQGKLLLFLHIYLLVKKGSRL